MNIPGFEIRFQKGYTYNYWDIKPCKTSGEDDFCLFRLRKDGKIDASAVKQNVGDTSEYVKLEATAPSMQETGNAGDGIPVNLAPDSGVQLVWWVPGESRPTTQFDILPNKDKGNSMKSYLMTTTTVTSGTATSYVRSCVDANCSTEIVGDTISYDPSKNSNRNSVENYPDPKNTTNNGDCNPALAGNSTHFYYDKGGRNGLPSYSTNAVYLWINQGDISDQMVNDCVKVNGRLSIGVSLAPLISKAQGDSNGIKMTDLKLNRCTENSTSCTKGI